MAEVWGFISAVEKFGYETGIWLGVVIVVLPLSISYVIGRLID